MNEYKQGNKIKVQTDKVQKYSWYSPILLESSIFEIDHIFFSPLDDPFNPSNEKQNIKVASCKCISEKSNSLFQFELADIQLV